MQKFLIVGLGNKGDEYAETRHNIGFKVIEKLAQEQGAIFEPTNFGMMAKVKVKGRMFFLLKPDTYMNLSGKAVKFWLQKENIEQERFFTITDDIHLAFGTIRIKAKGSDGGHNGLKSIIEELGNSKFNRLRFGVGADFNSGKQVDHVLGKWSLEEISLMEERLTFCSKAIVSFGLQGLARTMNQFNGPIKVIEKEVPKKESESIVKK